MRVGSDVLLHAYDINSEKSSFGYAGTPTSLNFTVETYMR